MEQLEHKAFGLINQNLQQVDQRGHPLQSQMKRQASQF